VHPLDFALVVSDERNTLAMDQIELAVDTGQQDVVPLVADIAAAADRALAAMNVRYPA
jgi:hypothetical protein